MNNTLPDDDEPKTWKDLAHAAILDLRRYARDPGPERRLVSAQGYEERFELLQATNQAMTPSPLESENK